MNDLAYFSAQKINKKEASFLKSRNFINNLNHIDQMWEYLSHKNGNTTQKRFKRN